jgi:molybdopterin-containing oxidoreductase family iron-sulfur binding subunit
VASALGAAAAGSQGPTPNAEQQRWLAAVAKDLQAHRGSSLVVAGQYQPGSVHALAREMNQALGNIGTTVTYAPAIYAQPPGGAGSLADLTAAMDRGEVQLLLILGGNPVFTAPADLRFGERLAKVNVAVYHGLHADETAYLCHWHVPDTHPLESWGDPRAYDGTVTLMQPLIAPLYEAHSVHELLASFTSQPGRRALDIVKDYWTRAFSGGGDWTIRDANGARFANADAFWNQAVHDGFIRGTAVTEGGPETPFGSAAAAPTSPGRQNTPRQPASADSAAAVAAPPAGDSAGGIEIIFRPDPTIWDGRFANNGWLQELPKPISKVTWDTCAWIGPALAEEQRLHNGDVVELRYRDNTARMPVFVVASHPARSMTVFYGYGRQFAGRVGNAPEQSRPFNPYLLRTSDAPWFGSGLQIARTGERYLLATTQEHHLMEGRAPVRVATLQEYSQEPEVIGHMGHTPPRTLTLYPEHVYDGYKWGMAIDLTACTGCGACTIACVAENNIPVVGKEEVARGREMHWIRVDHYFTGDIDHPETVQSVHQPVPCMHCETAPCELVCPVAATTHSSEGLNDMVYNRCVGTRYCSNNCPYKVRRFNFLLYSDWTTQSLEGVRNPDVTVRSRGIMEKCTYCVQRINQARIDAKREDRAIRDGEVVTACQAVCPASAIVFGDLNDSNSAVSKLKTQQRNYGVLEDLNTRPRTTYLAALRNPNPELEPAAAGTATQH